MDTIKISGIEIYGYHGLFKEEAKNGQDFYIDCEFTVDTSLCREEIEKTVHYGEVTMDIVTFATEKRYDLLETLGNDMVAFLLNKYTLMEELSITIHKPDAPIPTKFKDVSLTVTRKRTMVYLGIGSNLGDRKEYLDLVKNEIVDNKDMELITSSSYIETKPYGVLDQGDFLNGVVKLDTYLSPMELLKFCQNIEEKANRVRTRKWGERTLDVDILFYGNEIIYTDVLKIPHPEIQERIFVLEPLCEIDPYFIHPVRNRSVCELYGEIK